MLSVRLGLAAALLVLAVAACGGGKPAAPAATPTPESFLSHRGTIMPVRSALKEIAFKPFFPSRQIVETALLPAYNGGDDIKRNRGIGFEYVSTHESYVLSQWPGKPKSGPVSLPSEQGCGLSGYAIGANKGHLGVLWSNGTIVSDLQPSGNATTKATVAEARRLVRRGACR